MGVRRVVSSGNPYHDPLNGRFTNKPGSAGRRVAASNDYRTGKGTRRDGNTVSKTRGSNISADVRTRGNTARNVSADEAMRGTPRAVGGGGVLSSRDGSRRSMSTDPWGGLAKSIGGPRGRIGKTAADNRENMLQSARRAGREGEKGERVTAADRRREREDLRAKAAEAADRSRERAAKRRADPNYAARQAAEDAEFDRQLRERRVKRDAERAAIIADGGSVVDGVTTPAPARRSLREMGDDLGKRQAKRRASGSDARDSKMGTRRSVSDRERTAGGFYEEIVRNGQPIPRPSGDRLDSLVRDYELLNKSSALTAIRDLGDSGDEGARQYYNREVRKVTGRGEFTGNPSNEKPVRVATIGRETMVTSKKDTPAQAAEKVAAAGARASARRAAAESDLSKIAKASTKPSGLPDQYTPEGGNRIRVRRPGFYY